jgi:hypothetical protein
MTDMPPRFQTRRSKDSARGGKWFLVILGLSLVLIGGLFVWLLGRSYLRAKEMRSWPQVECVILSSEIRERIHDPQSPREFQQDVVFGYQWQGEARTSDRISLRGQSVDIQTEFDGKASCRISRRDENQLLDQSEGSGLRGVEVGFTCPWLLNLVSRTFCRWWPRHRDQELVFQTIGGLNDQVGVGEKLHNVFIDSV